MGVLGTNGLRKGITQLKFDTSIFQCASTFGK